MKKINVILILLLVSLTLSASSAFTYSFSQVGEKSAEGAFGSMSISLGFAPMKEKHYGLVEATVLLGWDKFFRGFDLAVSIPVYISSAEVFSYAFSNRVLWEPAAGILGQYRYDDSSWRAGFFISPFKFVDTNFSYEFLSPYLTFNISRWGISYGVRVMKITAFLEV